MKKILISFGIMLLVSSQVVAQTVTGSVTDASSGESLPGVNIMVKGTTTGVSTDTDGSYQLNVPSLKDTLIVSFIGYQTQEIPISGRDQIDIVLTSSTIEGEGVVVVGRGTQSIESVTGSIASVKTAQLIQSPAANLQTSLAGRLPGLTSIQRSGEPGQANINLYLRGQGTTNGQDPLILVDGVERDLQYINPNEVADISILKDASATSLYGVRGANGVVLVTTKRGKSGKPQIGFTAEYGLQDFTREPKTVEAHQWAQLKNQAARNDGSPQPYSKEALTAFQEGGNPLYQNNNWRGMLLHDYVPQQRYNLNISGSAGENNNARYFLNIGYFDQQGQWKVQQEDYDPSSYLKRYNFRSNIDVDLNSSLDVHLNLAGYLEKLNSPNRSAVQIFSSLNQWPSVAPGPLTPDGEIVRYSNASYDPPYAFINRTGYRQGTRGNILASFKANQDLDFITKGLSTQFMASFDINSNRNLNASRQFEQFVQVSQGDSLAGYSSFRGQNTSLNLGYGTRFRSQSNFQLQFNYQRNFGSKHDINGLLFSQKERIIRPNENIPYNLIGVSGRVRYGYDDKYFVEFNAGYNGSEQFASGNRFGFFPAVSAGWLISNENFFKNNKVLTHLKIRSSYGLVGNDRLQGRRFLYLDDVQVANGGYSPSLEGVRVQESFLGNPNVQWEVAKKLNLGFEIGLYDQLKLTVDVFRENRNNVLVGGQSTAPMLNGLPLGALPPVNIGEISNRGYEIVLDYNKVFSNSFSALAKINFNYAKNEVEYIGESPLPEDYANRTRREGYPIGQQFGFVTDGFFNSQEELDNSNVDYEVGRDPRVGDLKYVDLNGDGIINDADQAPIGYSNVPQYTFGASFQFNYRNFDLSFLFQGVANVSTNLQGTGVFEQRNFYQRHTKAWTQERYEDGLPIKFPALSLSTSSSENVNNTFFNERTDYIRLKNLEVGYTLPVTLTEEVVGSKEIRFYANGLNLFTWDKMSFKDHDPESTFSLAYPVYRVVNFGVKVKF